MRDKRRALITGASSGIGEATARRFAREGFDVALCARREPVLRELAARLPAGDHVVCAGDYSDSSTAATIERTLRDRWGTLDALVNCAGVAASQHVVDSDMAEWRQCLDTMVNGAVHTSRLAAK